MLHTAANFSLGGNKLGAQSSMYPGIRFANSPEVQCLCLQGCDDGRPRNYLEVTAEPGACLCH